MTVTDLAVEMAGFARVLRIAGVPADPERVALAAEAVTRMGEPGRRQIYWATRLAFCGCREDIARFHRAFLFWFGGRFAPSSPTADENVLGSSPAGDGGTELGTGARELLVQRDIGDLTDEQRAELNALVERLEPDLRPRPTLRTGPGGHRFVDPARTMRAMLRTDAEPARLRYRQRVPAARRLLLLVDVSGSMDRYSDAMLRFGHAALRAGPATTEAFLLGTRLTRVTPELRQRSADAALAAVGRLDAGRGGGTRLGRDLRELLRVWAGRRVVRSAVAVIASDGWDTDHRLLTEQVSRLRRLAHRVIWANPLFTDDSYRPPPALKPSLRLVEHVPAHNFAALESLAAKLAGR